MPDRVEARRIEPSESEHEQLSPWVETLADWMDNRYRVPGTQWRFGLDTLLGILPIAGDSVTAIIGTAMLAEAARIKAGPAVMAKMGGNLVADWVLGLVPGVDLVLDSAFKAHARNAKLLRQVIEKRHEQAQSSQRSSTS